LASRSAFDLFPKRIPVAFDRERIRGQRGFARARLRLHHFRLALAPAQSLAGRCVKHDKWGHHFNFYLLVSMAEN